ncbi:hypothetical protein [Paenibacillus sinopodophylli]|uniref:hypothetical protein n=1 Tax=Paenibacillus sinopodophylli TaxID=1837342 RepID=UPI00110D196F|nr:hypothetical protein [Paenibacillus sinopodophylli]
MNYIDALVQHPNAKIITGEAVTNVSGIATFYFTDDGTATGQSLLGVVYKAFVSSLSNSTAINTPSAELREINLAGKYVSATARAFTGVTVLSINVLGSVGFVSGATIYFCVIGE